MDTKKMLSIKEVMEILNVGRTTLFELTRKGYIKSYRIGRYRKYKAEEIEEYIRKVEIKYED